MPLLEVEYLRDSLGMPDKLAEGIAVLRSLWPFHDGPAHVVLADFNLEDVFLRSCAEECGPGHDPLSHDYDSTDHPVYAATSAVLRWILENTTEAERLAWAATY